MSPEDTFQNHIEDTHIAGAGLCDPEVVEMVVREAPQQIGDLIRFGVKFDLEGGELALTREGGHSHRRIVHALGDATGFEVMRALIARAKQTPNITLRGDQFTLDLLTHDGRCVGAIVWKQGVGLSLVWARQVILASGGCGMVYRETTNPPVATGDGMAAAWRAGAELRDMEFMQFHPTVLYVAGSARSLISEAVRGEGAYLRDVNGERFMLKEDPRHELAPRDVVSQAIFRCMERTQHPNVYLASRTEARSGAISRHQQSVQELWTRYYQGPHSGSARRALHGRRRHGRHEWPHDSARTVGGGRSDIERIAWRQSFGVELAH
jgi:L-aspartate oxidase